MTSLTAEVPNEVRDLRRHDFTIIDNAVIRMLPIIGVHVYSVYTILCYHANNNTRECWPSLSTIAQEVGISRRQVIYALDTLITNGLIRKSQRTVSHGGKGSNLYLILPVKEVPKGGAQDAPGVAHTVHQGSAQDAPKLDSLNKTKKNKTTVDGSHESQGNNNNSSGKQDPKKDVVVVLTQRGISENVAKRLADRHKKERIEEKIEFLEFTLETEPDKAKNPAGWLRRAIEENWAAPEGFISKAQRERQAAEKRRQAQETEAQELALQEDRRRRQEEEEQAKAAYLQLLNEQYATTNEDVQLWAEVVQSLKFQGSNLQALSEQIQPLKFRDETVLLGAPSEHIQAQFAHVGTRKVIEREIERVAGRPLRIEIVVEEKK